MGILFENDFFHPTDEEKKIGRFVIVISAIKSFLEEERFNRIRDKEDGL